jgi:2-oxoglutarate ferredoxin oxidoreductase subunit alpha
MKNVFTFIVGGKAGEGIRKAGAVAAKAFANKRRFVFNMVDYPSLIRGGHNFSVVSTSTKQVTSHYMRAELIVVLDERSYKIHRSHLKDNGIIIYNSDECGEVEGIGVPLTSEAKEFPNPQLLLGVGAVTILAAGIDLNKNELENLIKSEYPGGFEANIAYAMKIYDLVYPKIGGKFPLDNGEKVSPIFTGNELIALGAAAGGLDIYFAYPMTPSTSILHYFAGHDRKLDVTVIQPENEIAVINMAVGATFAGARAMIASSGGGFALMQEAFSLAGMVESPLLCVVSSRPGPSSGVPTYTEQADLEFVLYQGHGEFPRIVASPGSIEEAFYLTSQMLQLVWQFQTPGILFTMTVDLNPEKSEWAVPETSTQQEFKRYLNTKSGISPLLFPPSKQIIKWSSYEHDENGISTEDPEMITKMHDKRKRKKDSMVNHLKTLKTVNIFGNSGPPIFTYGSTTMSVLEALRAQKLEATVIQPIYLRPWPGWELEKYRNQPAVCIELNSTGQLARRLQEKSGISIKASINKYDGRPFDPLELAHKIQEVI